MRDYLKDLAVYYEGDYFRIKKALATNALVPQAKSDDRYIVIGDEGYPPELLELEHPPYVLFYRGQKDLLKRDKISIVGSRKPSQYSRDMTTKLAVSLKHDYVLVSGMARGIDTIVHQNALDFYSIAVLGCGVDIIYPKENLDIYQILTQNHLVISEYPGLTAVQKYRFPIRNRIVAALGLKLYVMSASMKSGTLHTVDHALALNKEVICLPHQIDDPSGEGCNHLIEAGASLVTTIKD